LYSWCFVKLFCRYLKDLSGHVILLELAKWMNDRSPFYLMLRHPWAKILTIFFKKIISNVGL
jgi:hypothetical protein